MNYESTGKGTATIIGAENTVSERELEEKCYSLEESKRLLLKKVHHHYHPEA